MSRFQRFLFWLTAIALFGALTLSVLSWLEICSEECASGHNYRILHMPFEWIGIPFFCVALLLHFALRHHLTTLLLLAGLGSEIMLAYLQHAEIGTYCPICLAIAACVFLATLCSFGITILQTQGKIMKLKFQSLLMLTIGFFLFFFGVTKVDALQTEKEKLQEKIVFGKRNSELEVYIFTDWLCPACRKADALFQQLIPTLQKTARVVFVDVPIHPETLNFIPYNLSFMLTNPNQYLALRQKLEKLSEDTTEPTDEKVELLASSLGVTYKQLNYADVELGIRYFKELRERFNVTITPSVVIVNKQDKKTTVLEGSHDITEAHILNALAPHEGS